ncbi:glycosyltransferase family 2 protein [Vibrio hippocampi]|uniref:Glycosyltransferase family 2 protein n=1 Tax=Vibrio hippocampi TaxID=654686 RepID=A0ABN8DP45_9VIBR|nr:glycosyltransferase family 2 protein [Vibrio hippocampi]CAH0529972.1 hypothetical protein VHP8226_03698 [Vibrio hippocampi]
MEWFWFGLFTLSAVLILYHHIGYPLLLAWYIKKHPLKPQSVQQRNFQVKVSDNHLPTITIVMPAYNEAQWIAEKIRNLAALDYPKNRLKVMIVCDGCTDETVILAQSTIQEAICADTYFEVLELKQNIGKVALLNQIIPQLDSDVTVLTDTSAIISIDALLLIAEQMNNPSVGAVNSHYQLYQASSQGEASYWQYQSKIKQQEAALGAVIGAHGALYAIRTHLFSALDPDTINDDFVIPMQVIRKGYQVVHATQLNAIELEGSDDQQDFSRRLRISAGNMQQTLWLKDLLSPKYGMTAFSFVSSKGLRLITPYLMLICLLSNAMLLAHPLLVISFALQIIAYTLGIIAHYQPALARLKPFALLRYLLLGHWANFIGGLEYLTKRTHRTCTNKPVNKGSQ